MAGEYKSRACVTCSFAERVPWVTVDFRVVGMPAADTCDAVDANETIVLAGRGFYSSVVERTVRTIQHLKSFERSAFVSCRIADAIAYGDLADGGHRRSIRIRTPCEKPRVFVRGDAKVVGQRGHLRFG